MYFDFCLGTWLFLIDRQSGPFLMRIPQIVRLNRPDVSHYAWKQKYFIILVYSKNELIVSQK